jgi:hypothetical protein
MMLVMVSVFAFARPAAAQGQFSVAQAQAIMRSRNWNQLLAYGKAWAKAEPSNADAWYTIARGYGSKADHTGLEEPAKAVPAYKQVVKLRPQWAGGWYALGVTEQELGQYNASEMPLLRSAAPADRIGQLGRLGCSLRACDAPAV